MTKGDANMDVEQSPSDDESSDSDVKEQPKGRVPFDEAPVIAELDLNRMLDPDIKWVCLGKSKTDPSDLRIFLSPDGWDPHELLGFIHAVCKPEFVIDTIKQGARGDNGK